jgi:hypothetical protein
MQHAMVANRNANASGGKPQDNMVTAQRDSDVMTLFVTLAMRFRSRPGRGVRVFPGTHALFISMLASRSRLAQRIN